MTDSFFLKKGYASCLIFFLFIYSLLLEVDKKQIEVVENFDLGAILHFISFTLK